MEKTRRKIIIKIVIAVICIVALIAAMLGGFWVFQNNLAEKYTFEEFSGQKGGDRIHFLNTETVMPSFSKVTESLPLLTAEKTATIREDLKVWTLTAMKIL